MTRLFISDKISDGTRFVLDEDNSRYISQVLRMKVGEKIVLVDCSGIEFVSTIIAIGKKEVALSIESSRMNTSESNVRITLFQSISKGERMDLTIQKATELGVYEIVPVISERVVVKVNPKDCSSKMDRWQKIALEASRQSGRGIVPKVNLPVAFRESLDRSQSSDLIIFPWEEEKEKGLKNLLRRFDGDSIAIFVGPEGGYSQEEAREALDKGANVVTLGSRILRTETAGPALIAMINYELEL